MSFRINTNTTAMTALRNVGITNKAFGQAVNRLSTGLRINSAADDPAGLIFSENFRAQISGLDQAIRNNQDAINYAKTAEGAVDEISRLLREGRTLAVASANSAVLSADQLQANQTQWNQIVRSINRIANETQFGRKNLLDGSSGVTASVVNQGILESVSFSGLFNGSSVTAPGDLDINVTQAATKATTTKSVTGTYANITEFLDDAAPTGTFSVNGYSFAVNNGETWGNVVARINEKSGVTGVTVDASLAGTNGSLKFTATQYGTIGNFSLSDSGVMGSAGTVTPTAVNAIAQVTLGSSTVTFNGGQLGNDGLTLTDGDGNVLKLQGGTATGATAGVAYVSVGSAQFQTGPNAANRTTLSIGSYTSSALSLDSLDLTSQSGAQALLSAVDSAIGEVSKRRGSLGSFMRNVLESNVRSLGVAKENLSATESSVRDADIAEEMTTYTKLQILQQSGLSVLAQANQSPQAILSLLQ